MTDIEKNEELAALRWGCRRGMLELDLILRPFLDGQYESLMLQEQGLFKALLACLDPDLFAWIFEGRPPTNPQFLPLLKKMRAYAHLGTAPQAL